MLSSPGASYDRPTTRWPSVPTESVEDPAEVAARRLDRITVSTFVVLLVVTARISFPFGGSRVALALPLTYLLVFLLIMRRRLSVSRVRAELYVFAITAVLAATWFVSMDEGSVSANSLLFLVVIYLPWVLRIAGPHAREVALHAGRTFMTLMVVIAVVGVLQFGSQLLGVWTFVDYPRELLPADLLYGPKQYNTVTPLFYASPTIKANGFVLLEPSFLSQYCALAIIIGLMLRAPAWKLVILAMGVASSVSGTGIILLAVGGILLLVRAPRQVRPAYVAAGAVALIVILVSPVAPTLLGRSGEINDPSSSGYARFSAPYTNVVAALEEEPVRYLVGAGPGSSDRVLPSARDGIGLPILYSTIPKLAFEYGLLAGGAFIVFLLVGMHDRAPWRVVPGSLVVMTFVLSGGLLQPQTAYLAWVFTALGSGPEPDS